MTVTVLQVSRSPIGPFLIELKKVTGTTNLQFNTRSAWLSEHTKNQVPNWLEGAGTALNLTADLSRERNREWA
jgi:hypothetical protein